MSMSYDNVVCGRLKLKGKALVVRDGGMKKKKKRKHNQPILSTATDGNGSEDVNETGTKGGEKGQSSVYSEYLTPAERRYMEQAERINLKRLEKMASKSHRDRLEEFNRYLANLTEHYDIPKVGPG